MKATQRIYRTADGELVTEGDPRAAFLAVPQGDEVPVELIDAVEALNAVESDVEPDAETGDDDDAGDAVDVVTPPPSNLATVAEWQAYATLKGIDPEGLTKAELIDAVEALD